MSGFFEDFGDFAFFDGALFDDAPVGFGDVDGGGAGADAVAAVDDEIETAVHGAEDFDAGGAGGDAAHVGAGGDEGLAEVVDDGRADGALGVAEGEAAGVAGDLERDLGAGGDDDGEGAGPEAAGEELEALGDFGGELFDHDHVVDEEREAAGIFAALGGEDLADGAEVEGVGDEHVKGVCGDGGDAAFADEVGNSADDFRVRIFLVYFNEIGNHVGKIEF